MRLKYSVDPAYSSAKSSLLEVDVYEKHNISTYIYMDIEMVLMLKMEMKNRIGSGYYAEDI